MHRPSAQQVYMQMIDRLPSIAARVDHSAIAVMQAILARDFSRSPKQMAQHYTMLLDRLSKRADMLSRHNQHMHWSLRIDIRKRDAQVILIDTLRRNASFNNPAKEAAHSPSSVRQHFQSYFAKNFGCSQIAHGSY